MGFKVTWNETLVGATVEASCTGKGLNGMHILCYRLEYFSCLNAG